METIETIRDLPELGVDDIHIWGVHIPDMLGRLDTLKQLLNQQELEKALRFHREADRQSSIASRGALRVLLGGYAAIPPSEIDFQYSENGKPSLVPQADRLRGRSAESRRAACDTISFNVSHSGDWSVLAFGRCRNIGVDVEKLKWEMDVMPIASRYFTSEEAGLIEAAENRQATFFQLWARKEAYVKACGSTLFRELSSFSVPMEDSAEKDGWIFRRLEAGSKYAAAVVTDKALASMPCYDFGGLKWQN
jgi:4'-phosphopantetheinyl transferase